MPFIGVISDTHGLVRPQALAALAGSECIVHAGDIGSASVLRELAAIAPVHAVRGNIDRDAWARDLPETDVVQMHDRCLYVLHDVHQLDLDPEAAGMHVVVSGHSHRPACEQRGAVLYVNPGSAGPRRFKLPIAVGRLHLESGALRFEIVELAVPT